MRRFTQLGLLGVIVVPLLLVSPAGDKIIDLLPFVGTVDEGNVTYRQRLLELAILVVIDNPLFGAFDYFYSAAAQELTTGDGIIDIVNTYLGVVLSSGLVGLTLFTGFFTTVAVGLFKGMRRVPGRNDELHLLGRALFATLLGILVIIFTVSSISIIPVIYWSLAGLCVAYARILVPATVSDSVAVEQAPILVAVRRNR